jgi:hypothetical protein
VLELLSLIGAPGAGKIFQIAGDFLSDRRRSKHEAEERAFRSSLAQGDKLTAYMEAIHGSEDDDLPSLHSVTMCALYIMFAVTTCVFICTCLYIQWELGNEALMVGIKDPEQNPSTWSILGGLIKGSRATNTITFISPLGVAYLALHPLLFVLGLVSSGRSPFKGSR